MTSSRSTASPFPPAGADRGGHLWTKDRATRADDGTLVAYTVLGPEGAPWLVCCAGYLCPDNFWVDLVPQLARDHRVIVLNYRGVGASSEARGGTEPTVASDYTIEALATDVLATMVAEDATDATVLGHSMGVQVALALWRAAPERIGALALIAGPYASPFHTFYGTNIGDLVFPVVSMGMPMLPRSAARLLLRSLELPIAMPVARLIRAMGPHTPDDGMRLYRWHVGKVDPRTAVWTARGMHSFDAGAWLAEVTVPTTVTTGSDDTWTPVEVAHTLVDRLPLADLTIVPGGSHTLPIEFPEEVLETVQALERRRRDPGRAG